jgi:hypothetical protein
MADQKMVTTAGSMGSKSNREGFVQFKPNFFLLTRKSKMENAPDIKSKFLKAVGWITLER